MGKLPSALQNSVVILAPTGKDARLACEVLSNAQVQCDACGSPGELMQKIRSGVGVVFLVEEVLTPTLVRDLQAFVDNQPPWSDLPLIVSTRTTKHDIQSVNRLRHLEALPNTTFVERPIRVMTLVSMVRAALSGRRRQFQVRDLLESERASREAAEHHFFQAEKADRLKGELLANVSHELRTPLTSMLGFSDFLMMEPGLCDHVQSAVETIHRNATAQLQIIDDLLDMSRIDAGQIVLKSEPLSLNDAITGAIQALQLAARAKNISIQTSCEHVPTLVFGDAVRLQQVVWNLISNAIKFAHGGCSVRVHLQSCDDQVVLTVADNGPGIDAEFLPFIFDRFRQQDGSTTRRHGGLGLGLSITKHLVSLHGGSIRAESDGPGKGAAFIVTLPKLHKTISKTQLKMVADDQKSGAETVGVDSSRAFIYSSLATS
ncbi:MAG: HAMP domain-containing histidine kinase [Pseudobdellovibrionaceae bacterium]|nr:HAMP domain-containing histidine kinase [Pseudobdellovibrionaceae bacterium]